MNGENDATVHQLMNEVTECLQYARALTGVLAEFVGDAGEASGRDLALALRAVEALAELGYQRAMRVHTQLVWEEAGPALG